MSAELKPDLQLEIAYLLLIDVVGYSKLLVNEQVELLHELNRVVRSTDCFRAAEKEGKLIRLPTGDGMALLFFRSPEQPVQCALQITQALQDSPHIQVRMGIHSGPVNQVTDVNDRSNVAGTGINVAQRVLDCGDAGHILVSKHLADDLRQYRHWQPYLRDLGECEVKHGLRLHVVNLCKDKLGNPQVPEKLKPRKRWQQAATSVRPVSTSGWPRWAPAAALLLSGGALAFSFAMFLHRSAAARVRSAVQIAAPAAASIPAKSIAVLPFENLSDDKQNAYFADGVQDEILTNLAKVADLKVISRTSVMQYRTATQRNVREIAKALGVAHVLEGTVQRAGGRVRVNAQLIDARTDTHVWAERYDREIADVFAIENELSEQIVSQLKSRLSPQEKAAIEQKPTADLAAHDLYTRAKILIDKSVFNDSRKTLFEAVRLLEQAVARDAAFVLAHYQLAHAHDQIYLRGFDRSPARLAAADAAVQAVRRLQPDSGEAHLALAKHLYWGYRDYERARQEIEQARRALPNDPAPFLLIGYLNRRQGRWDDSIRDMQRAIELDPQNFFILQQIALTYQNLRRYTDMAAVLDRALKLAPAEASIRIQRAQVDLHWRANLEPLRSTIAAIVSENPNAADDIAESAFSMALYQRDVNAATEALRRLPPDSFYGYDREAVSLPRAWCEGVVARMRSDAPAAMTAFALARRDAEKIVHAQPENGGGLCALAMIDVALGRNKDAIHEGKRALELLPLTTDAIDGAVLLQYLAAIYGASGKKDAAFQQLATAAKIPGSLSFGQLKLDPLWDPLRGDPRFDKIVRSLAPPP